MRADGSWAERLSLIPTQHYFQGSAHQGQGCPLFLPELHGAPVGPFLLLSTPLDGSPALMHIDWPSLAWCHLQS